MNIFEHAEGEIIVGDSVTPFTSFKTDLSKKVTEDIFNGVTYPILEYTKDVKVIVDIGANIGAASVYFAMAYPEAKVYSFEPGRRAYYLLVDNASKFDIHPFPFGLYCRDAVFSLRHGKIDSVESSILMSSRVVKEFETVSLRSCKTVFKDFDLENKIDILKVDTEGCEMAIFKSISPSTLASIQVMYVEYHSENARQYIDSLMINHSLWKAKVENVHRGEFCYLRNDLVPENLCTPELEASD